VFGLVLLVEFYLSKLVSSFVYKKWRVTGLISVTL
jgi:hypothetical protein